MTKKSMAEKAQNVNANVVTNPELENVNANVVTNLENAKAEAAKLAEAAREAARVAKEAAKAAKEAAEKAKVLTARPVRLARFQAELDGEIISKTDVHYCAEKAAIDYLVDLRNNGNYENQIIEIWKRRKDATGNDVLLSTVYVDVETNQVVID